MSKNAADDFDFINTRLRELCGEKAEARGFAPAPNADLNRLPWYLGVISSSSSLDGYSCAAN